MKKVFVKIGRGFVRVGTLVQNLFGTVEKVDAIYHALTPEAKAGAIKTFQDAAKLVVDAEMAGVSQGTNLVLDAQVIADVKQLYSDAMADVTVAKQVFAALGVALPVPVTPALPKAA